MKIVWIIGIVIVLAIGVLAGVLSYYGLFSSIQVAERDVGPYLLVYTKHIGDYNEVAPVMDKVYSDLKDRYDIETTKGFGLYYDNPQEISKEKLRSIVGCIVEGKSMTDLSDVKEKYGVKEYPLSKSVVADFPHKGYLSIVIGVMKVYPRLNEYIQERKYDQNPIMELYDQPNKRTEYIASVGLSKEVFESFLEY